MLFQKLEHVCVHMFVVVSNFLHLYVSSTKRVLETGLFVYREQETFQHAYVFRSATLEHVCVSKLFWQLYVSIAMTENFQSEKDRDLELTILEIDQLEMTNSIEEIRDELERLQLEVKHLIDEISEIKYKMGQDTFFNNPAVQLFRQRFFLHQHKTN